MNCKGRINLERNPKLVKLQKDVNNFDEFMKYITFVCTGESISEDGLKLNFNNEFKKWFKEKYPNAKNLDTEHTNPNILSKAIRDYYNAKRGNVQIGARTSNIFSKDTAFGYSSIAARNEAIRVFASQVLLNFNRLSVEERNKINDIKEYLTEEVINNYISALANRLSIELNEEVDADTIFDEIAENDDPSVIEKYIDENISQQVKNVYATVKELLNSPIEGERNFKQEFIDEVFNDSRLSIIKNKKDINQDEESINKAAETQIIEDGETTPEESTEEVNYDMSIRVYDSHDGVYKDFMVHVNPEIKAVLSSIYIKEDAYGNNEASMKRLPHTGFVDVHNANEIATILYQTIDRTDVESMIESIRTAGKTMPGYAGLKDLADKLASNKELAFAFYRTFGKLVISKFQTQIIDGKPKYIISDNTTSRLDILQQDFIRDFKRSAINMNIDSALEDYKKLRKGSFIKGFKDLETAFIEDLYVQLRQYIPSINKASLYLFLYNNKDLKGAIDVGNNANILKGYLYRLISDGAKVRNNYLNLQAKRYAEYVKNKAEMNKAKQEAELDGIPFDSTKYNTISIDYYAEDYITPKETIEPLNLAKLLLPYSTVKVNLNVTNVHGNKSSAVINSSMITNLMNIFQNKLNQRNADGTYNEKSPLVNFGTYRFQSQQYDFSNIMIEHRDPNDSNKIINYGLFKLVDGKYVPTDYATKLISFELFDGASNKDTGNSVIYKEMSKGDYIGTAWLNFYNRKYDTHGASLTSYFLRTPSDAPKTFIMNHPVYRADDLFVVNNKREVENSIDDIIANAIIKNNPVSNVLFNSSYEYIKVNNENDVINYITANGDTEITIPYKKRSNKGLVQGQEATVAFTHTVDRTGGEQVVFTITGIYDNGKLTKAVFNGFTDNNNPEILSNNFAYRMKRKILSKINREGSYKGIKYNESINTKSVLFQQLRNAFVQELTDAATALDVIFKTSDVDKNNYKTGRYHVARDTNNHKLIYRNGDNSTSHLNDNYHHKKGKIVSNEEIGSEELTGNVFHSDRFVIYNSETGQEENFGEKIINEAIDFLYKGDDAKMFEFTKENGKITPIITDSINEAIERNISEFIQAYVNEYRKAFAENKEFLKETGDERDSNNTQVTTTSIAEFALNYHLAYIDANDLLEGDTKFYKGAQDFLKRAKEYQGSGVPFGVTNFSEVHGFKHEIESELDKYYDKYGIRLSNGFNAITCYNTVKTDTNTIERLVKKLIDDCHLSEAEARKLMYGKDGNKGYTNSTVNDAQSYITFEEWIRRVTAKGELEKYRPLIDKILDENSILTADELNEFVQVQKNFYYDQFYNTVTRTVAPRQIKNAEFVLIPRFIKGTELEDVYNFMKKNNVDQLNTIETSKAANSDVITIWDNDGNYVLKEDQVVKPQPFMYSHLYTQQETPQHMNSTNKASIQIMKKMLDNISKDSKLAGKKQEIFDLYVANIKDSFNKLMKEFNIPIDENGNIKVDENGNIEGVNYDKFFKRFNDELNRTGVDSNMKAYVTLDGVLPGSTVMPNYFSLVVNKLESVAQSLFNSNITRQTLPGFHAAQVTQVGFRRLDNIQSELAKKISSPVRELKADADFKEFFKSKFGSLRMLVTTKITDELKNEFAEWYKANKKSSINYIRDKNLEYHPMVDGKVQPYIEIMLPASAFGFNRNSESAKKVRQQALAEGLTKEEAEHKVSEFFLNQLKNAKLDTVLGYRIPTEGKQSVSVMKVVRLLDDSQGSTIIVPDAWVAQTGADFDIDSIYAMQKHTYFDKLGNFRKIEFIENNEVLYMNYIRRNVPKREWNYIFENSKLTEDEINDIKEKYTEADGKINWELAKKEIKDTSREIKISDLNELINKYNLESFSEYSKRSIYERNTREARDNKLVENMIDILSSDETLEENLSRSNFDDIIECLEEYIESITEVRNERKARSPYNFLSQASFQYDAMSGAKLKAFSFIRDNFCSICNTVKPVISDSHAIDVVYTFNTKEINKEEKYNELVARFGKNNVKERTDNKDNFSFTVTHDKIGWSADNKNVDGKLITVYSSETTAHSFDAIKSGNIPNVNDLTFAAYKTFVDIGSNYNVAISFMMQQGVKDIVDVYNKSKSIYAENTDRNYATAAVRNIAKRLNLSIDNYDTLDDIIEQVNAKFSKEIKSLFGVDRFDLLNTLPFNLRGQELRLKGFSNEVWNHLFDINTVLQYMKISSLGNHIGSLARVSNPDKFGAKQSIFATNEIFDKIQEIKSNDTFPIQVDGKNFLEAIYPKVTSVESLINNNNINESKYPTLYAFLKYATASSIVINRALFATQRPEFRQFIKGLQNRFSDGRVIDEKTYKDFQNYVINSLYKKCSFINSPLGYDIRKGFIRLEAANDRDNIAERTRIFGYGHNADLNVTKTKEVIDVEKSDFNHQVKQTVSYREEFNVKDISKPTKEELEDYMKLSPAQKITWLKQNFENQGIFEYIRTDLYKRFDSKYARKGAQTIEFIEDSIDPETAYQMFYEAFTNKNPLVSLAAADIVKYAFMVEGYKIGMRNVSKVIDNKVLSSTSNVVGTNIVAEMNQMVNEFSVQENENLYDDYIRSHSNIKYINTRSVNKIAGRGYDLKRFNQGLIIIGNNVTNRIELITKYGIGRKSGKNVALNSYVKLKFGKDTILYKIKYDNALGTVLVPLNLLEQNEVGDYSSNNDNNIYPNVDENKVGYYDVLLDKYATNLTMAKYASTLDAFNTAKNEVNPNDYRSKYIRSGQIKAEPFILEKNNPLRDYLINKINDWTYSESNLKARGLLYIQDGRLVKYFKNMPKDTAILFTVPIYERDNNGNVIRDEKGEPKVSYSSTLRMHNVNTKKWYDSFVKDERALNATPLKEHEGLVETLRTFYAEHPNYQSPYVNDIFEIMSPNDEDILINQLTGVMFSKEEDVYKQGIKTINRRMHVSNDNAARLTSETNYL